jgi:hypothetical protein
VAEAVPKGGSMNKITKIKTVVSDPTEEVVKRVIDCYTQDMSVPASTCLERAEELIDYLENQVEGLTIDVQGEGV